MLIATVSTIISLIFLIAFVAAMIILQVYLSRRESKLPGLVLPAITFSGELFILLNVVTNVVMTSAADNAVGGVDSYSVFVTVLNTVLTLLVISMPTVKYFPLGEDKFASIVQELKKAKKFIFM